MKVKATPHNFSKRLNNQKQMKPYKFKPYLKSVIWGGDKIAKLKGIANDRADIGESWEISGIAGHESICAERGISPDPDLGLTLYQLIDKYRASLVGHKVYRRFGGTFPLLVKFIDSHRDLSIQVHPNDELARRRHNCAGKTEMWYIMHAEPGAKIYTGLTKNLTPEEYEQLALKANDGDANPFAEVSPLDAVHMTANGHLRLAEAMADKIRSII